MTAQDYARTVHALVRAHMIVSKSILFSKIMFKEHVLYLVVPKFGHS